MVHNIMCLVHALRYFQAFLFLFVGTSRYKYACLMHIYLIWRFASRFWTLKYKILMNYAVFIIMFRWFEDCSHAIIIKNYLLFPLVSLYLLLFVPLLKWIFEPLAALLSWNGFRKPVFYYRLFCLSSFYHRFFPFLSRIRIVGEVLDEAKFLTMFSCFFKICPIFCLSVDWNSAATQAKT